MNDGDSVLARQLQVDNREYCFSNIAVWQREIASDN